MTESRLVIAAIGEAGEGKSTLLNLILSSPGQSREIFEVSEEPEACTTSPSYRSDSGSGHSHTLHHHHHHLHHHQCYTLQTK